MSTRLEFRVQISSVFSVLRKSRVVVGGLHAPNLFEQFGLLAVALVCNEGRWTRTGSLGRPSSYSRRHGGNGATQRFRQHVVEADGEAEQDHEERHDVAPKQRLVQIKVVDDENGGELQRDEGECVLSWSHELVLVANVDSHGHEQPIQPRKGDGHFVGGKHAHIGEFQGDELTPHGRRLGANERQQPK